MGLGCRGEKVLESVSLINDISKVQNSKEQLWKGLSGDLLLMEATGLPCNRSSAVPRSHLQA